MHYAKRYKKEINRLKRIIDEYYHAIYHLQAVHIVGEPIRGCGVYGGLARMEGNEETAPISDLKTLKEMVDELPLIDPGMLIEE